MRKALFLDLDHTLICPKSGNTFPRDKDDWEFMPNVLWRLWYMLTGKPDALIVVVTNQGGVAAGHQTREDVESRMLAICTQLRNHTGAEVHSYVSYEYDDFRKPLPGMAHKAAADLAIDLTDSIMVGDMLSDAEFAANAGIGTFIWAEDYFKAGPPIAKAFVPG